MEPRSFERGDKGGDVGGVDVVGPSMEPRSFERGDRAYVNLLASGVPPFNGATLFRAWRLIDTFLGVAKYNGLQWSHALSSVETAGLAAR